MVALSPPPQVAPQGAGHRFGYLLATIRRKFLLGFDVRPAVVLDRLGRWGYSCREVSQIAGRDVAQSAFGMLPQSQPGALRSY